MKSFERKATELVREVRRETLDEVWWKITALTDVMFSVFMHSYEMFSPQTEYKRRDEIKEKRDILFHRHQTLSQVKRVILKMKQE